MAHWRDSARIPRFFLFDARAAFPLMFFLLHIRFWTFGLAVVATIFFAAIERYGFTVSVFLRWVRTKVIGRRKLANPWWR